MYGQWSMSICEVLAELFFCSLIYSTVSIESKSGNESFTGVIT